MPDLRFECRLESDQEACFIRVPPEVLTTLGQRKRAPVKVTINAYTYRTTIAVYGGKSYIGVRREVREAAGVAAGDQLTQRILRQQFVDFGGQGQRGPGNRIARRLQGGRGGAQRIALTTGHTGRGAFE